MGGISFFSSKFFVLTFFLLLGALNTGCVHNETNLPTEVARKNESILEVLANSKIRNKQEIMQGVQELIGGEYKAASSTFNNALLDDPKNPILHYFNAYTYQLMSERGEGDKYDLATVGYSNALEYDPSNWLAYLQLGRIFLQQKKYPAAQEAFANVLLFKADHPGALYSLAVASYYAHDLKHALQYITKAVAQQPGNAQFQRSAAIIAAAAGEKEHSHQYYEKYRKHVHSEKEAKYVGQRIKEWENLYKSGVITLAQAEEGTQQPTSANSPVLPDQTLSVQSSEEDNLGPNDMVIIDGAVLRVSEQGKTSKGNNILDSLNVAFNLNKAKEVITTYDNTTGLSHTGTSRRSRGFNIFTGPMDGSLGDSAMSYPLIYALNIANVARTYIEVIGRPTLAVSIGKEGDFYSGDNRYLPIQGERGGSIEKLPIGISLKVTPVSISGNIVTLKVAMTGSSVLTDPSGSVTDNYLVASDSHITTEVQTKIGETVILGGIKLRDRFDAKAGVPILQDIPLIEYFFSKESTTDDKRTVLYMLTVRGYSKDIKSAKAAFVNEDIDQPSLEELDLRNKNWFNPRSNILMMLKSLSSVYRDFRTGDLVPLHWDMPDDFFQELDQITAFLLY